MGKLFSITNRRKRSGIAKEFLLIDIFTISPSTVKNGGDPLSDSDISSKMDLDNSGMDQNSEDHFVKIHLMNHLNVGFISFFVVE